MEYSRPPFSASPRLLLVANPLFDRARNGHHFLCQLRRARARHGLHHQEAARLWAPDADAAASHRRDTAVQVRAQSTCIKCEFSSSVRAYLLTVGRMLVFGHR